MKVKATQEVYIRSNVPYQKTDNKKGILYPGFEIEVEEQVDGQSIDGNTKWFKDKNGDFYWSGGFEKKTDLPQNIHTLKFNYNERFNIPDQFRNTLGENIKIALLDTGINPNHISLKNKTLVSYNALENNPNGNDVRGHGTHCAGLINSEHGEIIGVAPKCNLLSAKTIDDQGITFERYVNKALEWAIDQKVDIINMSFSINKKYKEKIHDQIKQAYDADILLIGSAGENEYIMKENKEFLYPSCFDECISVGAVSNDYIVDNRPITFNSNLDLVLNYVNFLSSGLGNNDFVAKKGSSMATAIISGIAALMLSAKPNNAAKNIDYFKDNIDKISVPFESAFEFQNKFQIISIK